MAKELCMNKKLTAAAFALFMLATINCSSDQKKDPEPPAKTETAAPAKGTETAAPAKTETASKPASTSRDGSAGGTEKETVNLRSVDQQGGGPSAILPSAKPGQCFRKYVVPATYREIAEQIVKKPASETIETIPAKYEDAEEKVQVKPASSYTESVPPVYETVEERVLVKPESKRLVQIPAEFETIEDKVVDKEGYSTWRKDANGDLLCLVEVPPTYKMIKKEVIKTPASVKEEVTPAEFATVKVQKEKAPATTRQVEVPAQFETVKTKKLLEPEKQNKTLVPAVTETVTKSILDKPEREEWKEVLCENNTTPEVMAEIERALKAAGFDSGNTDDKKADSKTFSALNDYQKSKGLPVDVDKVINIDTVNSLGIKVKK